MASPKTTAAQLRNVASFESLSRDYKAVLENDTEKVLNAFRNMPDSPFVKKQEVIAKLEQMIAARNVAAPKGGRKSKRSRRTRRTRRSRRR